MKKHLSVFGLFVRSSIYKVIGILLIMCALEILLFHTELKGALSDYNSESEHNTFAQLENIFSDSIAPWCFALAFALITVALCLTGTEYKSKTGYTLRRLSVSEKHVFFYQALCNFFMYFLLWATQAALCYILSLYYINSSPEAFLGNQTVFLAFYRSKFLHAVLPLSNALLWVRNFLLIIALSLSSAEFPFKQRRKSFSVTIIALCVYCIAFFSREIGDIFSIVTVLIVSIAVTAEMLYTVFYWEAKNES